MCLEWPPISLFVFSLLTNSLAHSYVVPTYSGKKEEKNYPAPPWKCQAVGQWWIGQGGFDETKRQCGCGSARSERRRVGM